MSFTKRIDDGEPQKHGRDYRFGDIGSFGFLTDQGTEFVGTCYLSDETEPADRNSGGWAVEVGGGES